VRFLQSVRRGFAWLCILKALSFYAVVVLYGMLQQIAHPIFKAWVCRPVNYDSCVVDCQNKGSLARVRALAVSLSI